MAFMDGTKKNKGGSGGGRSGGNVQREKFNSDVAGMKGTSGLGDKKAMPEEPHEGDMQSTMIHHEDGTHSIKHADGESTGPHPTMGHAMMAMATKHEMGSHGHIHDGGDGSVTTHHVGMDGEVQGPHQHESMDAGMEHMKGCMDGGGEGSMDHMMEQPETSDYA